MPLKFWSKMYSLLKIIPQNRGVFRTKFYPTFWSNFYPLNFTVFSKQYSKYCCKAICMKRHAFPFQEILLIPLRVPGVYESLNYIISLTLKYAIRAKCNCSNLNYLLMPATPGHSPPRHLYLRDY